MSELFEKSIRTLELPAVLEKLAAKAVSQAAKDRCLKLTPSTDVEEVLRLLDETDAAKERLDIADVLTASRRVSDYDAQRQGEETVLDRLFTSLHTNKYLEEQIRSAILDEETIADTASSELADIRRKMRLAASKGRQILQRIISSPSASEETNTGAKYSEPCVKRTASRAKGELSSRTTAVGTSLTSRLMP